MFVEAESHLVCNIISFDKSLDSIATKQDLLRRCPFGLRVQINAATNHGKEDVNAWSRIKYETKGQIHQPFLLLGLLVFEEILDAYLREFVCMTGGLICFVFYP